MMLRPLATDVFSCWISSRVGLPDTGEGREDDLVQRHQEQKRPDSQDEPALSFWHVRHHDPESPIQRNVKVNWAGIFPLMDSTFSP